MSRTCFILVLPIWFGLGIAHPAFADIILNSITASVSASIDPGPPLTGSSTLAADSITRTFIGTSNNFTTSSESHNWDGLSLTLTGQSLITEAKTIAAGPGRTHRGLSSLTFDFSTPSNTNYSLSGTYGFVNDSVTLPDSVSWSLIGPATNLSQSALAGGGSSQVFFSSGQLGVGTYTFTISARLDERINNASTNTANWNMAMFYLQPLTAIPEARPTPAAVLLIGLACFAYFSRRKQRWRAAFSQVADQNLVQLAPSYVRQPRLTVTSRRRSSRKFDRNEFVA